MKPSPKRMPQPALCTVFIILLLASSNTSLGQTQSANPQQAAVSARVDAWLAQSGLNFRKASDSAWLVHSKGKVLTDVPILIGADAKLVVVGSVVAKKDSFERSSDLMFKLLKLNNSADFVKVGFDDDEDLFVRVELRSEIADSSQFNNMLNDITKTADEAHKLVKLYPKTK